MQKSPATRSPQHVDWLLLACVGFLAVYFYQSIVQADLRIAKDVASHFFKLVNDGGSFLVSHSRWSGVLYRIPTLLAAKAGADLKTLLVVFSLTPTIVYICAFFTLYLSLRRPDLAVAFLIANFAHNGHRFFFPLGGTQLAMPFLILFFLLLQQQSPSAWPLLRSLPPALGRFVQLTVLFALAVFCIFFHPINLLLVLYLILLQVLLRGFAFQWRSVLALARTRTGLALFGLIVAALIALIFHILSNPVGFFGTYEIRKTRAILDYYSRFANLGQADRNLVAALADHFMEYAGIILRHYPWIPIGLLLLVFCYFRRPVIILYVASIVILYLVLADGSYKIQGRFSDSAHLFSRGYAEHAVRPVFLMLGLPICLRRLQARPARIVLGGLLLLLFLTFFIETAGAAKEYANRKDDIQHLVRAPDLRERSAALVGFQNLKNFLSNDTDWFLYETLIYSSLLPDGSPRMILISDTVPSAAQLRSYLPHGINTRIFPIKLAPTGKIDVVNMRSDLSLEDLAHIDPAAIHVEWEVPVKGVISKQIRVIANIQNRNSIPLKSGLDGDASIYLFPVWERSGAVYLRNRPLPLHLDIHTQYNQIINVDVPDDPGNYLLKLYLMARVEPRADETNYTCRNFARGVFAVEVRNGNED